MAQPPSSVRSRRSGTRTLRPSSGHSVWTPSPSGHPGRPDIIASGYNRRRGIPGTGCRASPGKPVEKGVSCGNLLTSLVQAMPSLAAGEESPITRFRRAGAPALLLAAALLLSACQGQSPFSRQDMVQVYFLTDPVTGQTDGPFDP